MADIPFGSSQESQDHQAWKCNRKAPSRLHSKVGAPSRFRGPALRRDTDSVLNAKVCEKICHSNNSRAVVDCEKNRVLGLHKDGVGNMDNMSSADEMWESLVMGTSQMERIDERAEEFIAKFRVEMQNQEMLARYL